MPLVIYGFGVHKHTHTHAYSYKSDFKKPGTRRPVPGLKTLLATCIPASPSKL